MKMRTVLIYISLYFISYGCNFTTAKLNRIEDIDAAKKTINEFYSQVERYEYKQSLKFYADTFLNSVDTSTLFKFYKKYELSSGKVKDFSFRKCETKAVKTNGKLIVYYLAVYDVSREIRSTQETFILKSYNGNNPKIYRYDILEKFK